MDYNYRLNCGQYVLHQGDKPIGPVMDEVAIAFDRECGTLHKHGSVEMVRQWLQKSQDTFRQAGFPDMAENLIMIAGRFDLEDLNRCLSTTGYLAQFYPRLLRCTLGVAGPLDS